MSKKNTVVTENELSIGRWIATIIVCLLIGFVLMAVMGVAGERILRIIPAFSDGGSFEDQEDYLVNMFAMAGLFWGFVIGLKVTGKTSVKAFILNANRTSKIDLKKEVFPILGLYLLGFIIIAIPDIGNIEFSGKSAGKIVFLIIFDFLFIWMQTSWEEFIFRGLPLRVFCKNDIGLNKKSIIVAVITSLLFMAVHIPNPEVQSLSGDQAVYMTISYFAAGMGFFLSDLLVGNLLPGLLIHWINNFYLILILSQEVSVAGASSIWVDHTPGSGLTELIHTFIAYIPVMIYLIIKHKKANSTNVSVSE